MADTNVRFIFSAEGLDGLSSKIKTFAGILGGAFAGKKILDFGIDAVKGFAEAEAATARVNTVLDTLGKVGEESRDKLFEMSQAAVKLGFDDEAAAESLAKFLQRTNDLTDAQNLNNIAMDLARAKNIDLATATTLVNQVLSGNGRVLKQYGIDLKESGSPLEALGELHDKVRGQAEAFADTTAGRMAALSESFSNVKDALGGALAKGLQPFMDKMLAFVSDPRTIKWVTDMAELIGKTLVESFKIATKVFNDMVAGWEVIFAFLDNLQKKIDAVTSGIRGLLGMKDLDTSGNRVGSAGQVIRGRASGGDVSSGTPYIVGEMGPEMFVPGSNGTIIPNNRLAGGITINITGNQLLSQDAGEVISEMIMRKLKANLRL